MSDHKKPLVIVLTRNYSTGLGVVRALGSQGFTVDLIGSTYKSGKLEIATRSKYVRNFTEVVADKVKEETGDPALVEAIMAYAGKEEIKPLLIPTDDYTTSIMDMNRDLLQEHFIMPYLVGGKQGDLANLMDKTTQSKYAKAVGLTTAKGWGISLRDEIRIPEDMVYPCYVKPIKSIAGFKTEMAICNNEEELSAHLLKLQSNFANRDIYVQEFLNIETEIASAGLCLDQHVILPAVIKKGLIGQHGRGVTLTGSLVPFEELVDQETVDKAIALLKSLHYVGLFGMEFAIVDGKPYFNEVNLRSAGEGAAYYQSGANLPLIYTKYLLGEEIDPEEEKLDRFGIPFIYDKIAWEDYMRGYISKETLEEAINSSELAILCNDDDPEPGNLFIENNMKVIERREVLKQCEEKCIQSTMEATGWDYEQAKRNIKRSRELTHVSYADYVASSLYRYPFVEQNTQLNLFYLDREKKVQLREECIQNTMAHTDWDYDTCKNNIHQSRKRTKITYEDYTSFKMYLIPLEEQKAYYLSELDRSEREMKEYADCIISTMRATEWNPDVTKKNVADAVALTGITPKEYMDNQFYKVKPENQLAAYEKIKSK